jgi:hypothetical protein
LREISKLKLLTSCRFFAALAKSSEPLLELEPLLPELLPPEEPEEPELLEDELDELLPLRMPPLLLLLSSLPPQAVRTVRATTAERPRIKVRNLFMAGYSGAAAWV